MDIRLLNSLLLAACALVPIRSWTDHKNLKDQRDEKRKKDELVLKLSYEKATEYCIEKFFRLERHGN